MEHALNTGGDLILRLRSPHAYCHAVGDKWSFVAAELTYVADQASNCSSFASVCAASVEKYVGNSATVKADIELVEYIDGCLHGIIISKIPSLQLGGSKPTRIFVILPNNCATNGSLFAALAAGGQKAAIGYIVLRQGISHENDVTRLHRGRTQVTLDFLDERRRRRLERTLHHGLSVMRVGQRAAVKARASIYPAFFSLVTFLARYPIWERSLVKRSQRWWREQAGGMKIPLIAVVSGQLAAVRAFPPAQAAVRKQEFDQSDP